MRKNRKRNNDCVQEVECSFSREYKGGPGPNRTQDKTTKKKMPSNGVHRKISNDARKVRIKDQCLTNSID
jgi:hypothetical protein